MSSGLYPTTMLHGITAQKASATTDF